MLLKDRVAVITGAGRGIGRAIAEGFAREGAKVIVTARSNAEIAAAAQSIRDQGLWAESVCCDVSKEEQVASLAQTVNREFGGASILVNNAGLPGQAGLLHELNSEEWVKTMDVNVSGVFFCCKYFIPQFKEKGSGAIINVSSGAGVRRPWQERKLPRSLPYTVSKFALEGLTQGLASQLYPLQIAVNAMAPGTMDTAIHAQSPPEWRRNLRPPEDIIPLALFLALQTVETCTGATFELGDWETRHRQFARLMPGEGGHQLVEAVRVGKK